MDKSLKMYDMEANIIVKIGNYDELYADAHKVRNPVFVLERGVDYSVEQDSEDKTATHFVLYENNRPTTAFMHNAKRKSFMKDWVANPMGEFLKKRESSI